MSSLYNITEKYLNLCKEIEDNDGELTPELEKELAINEEEVEDKLKAYYYIIAQTKGEIDVISDEISRLKEKQNNKDKLIERLKKATNNALMLFGVQQKSGNYKLEFPDLTIFNVFHKPVLVEDDFSDQSYIKYKIPIGFTIDDVKKIQELLDVDVISSSVPQVTKTELKKDLLSGKEVNKARIDYTASYVRFK
jgi:hypothetical protein